MIAGFAGAPSIGLAAGVAGVPAPSTGETFTSAEGVLASFTAAGSDLPAPWARSSEPGYSVTFTRPWLVDHGRRARAAAQTVEDVCAHLRHLEQAGEGTGPGGLELGRVAHGRHDRPVHLA